MRNIQLSISLCGVAVFLLSFIVDGPSLYAQTSLSNLKSQAETLVKQHKYADAAKAYSQYVEARPRDWKVQLRLAELEFKLQQFTSAAGRLNYVRSIQKKEQPDVIYLQAQILHADQQFKQAAVIYKQFLKVAKSRDSRRNTAALEVLRCYQGIQLQYADKLAIVENLGERINYSGDDVRPVISPNNPDKIYLSSMRPLGEGRSSFMILSATQDKGSFKSTAFLPAHLNTNANEILQDFNADGSVMFFFRGTSDQSGRVLRDTFKESVNPEAMPSFWADCPAITEKGDKDLQLFNDSTLLFSSRRLGGFGGYDLYISERNNGEWMKAQNLGPVINSGFDEVSPFLCRDGRTLFFSSNSGKSMGGFDVFKAIFTDSTNTWQEPANMALPVNSALNDLDFRISPDGTKAFFSSDRPGGFGGKDLFIAHLRTRENAQFDLHFPVVFSRVGEFNAVKQAELNNQETTTDASNSTYQADKGKLKLKIEPLFIREGGTDVSVAHQTKLTEIVNAMQRFPRLQVEIRAHVNETGTATFLLYSSLQQASTYAEYLINNGIGQDRIILKGLGNQYPIAASAIEGKPNPSAQFFNRRVEIVLHGTDPDLDLTYEFPEISQTMRDTRGYDYMKKLRGVTYKVQFASLRQMYAGDLMEKYTEGSIELRGTNQFLQYTVGLVKRTSEAINIRTQVRNDGFNDAFIVPYLDGVRLLKSDINEELLDKYPDLKNYIRLTE